MPDDLLERLDVQARSNRETRSGFLRRLAERELERDEARQRSELEDLLGPPLHMGGDSARLIREDREAH